MNFGRKWKKIHSLVRFLFILQILKLDGAIAVRKVWRRVEALEGREAILPCEVGSVDSSDVIYVVLWYLNGRKEPIYSYDNRPYPLHKSPNRNHLQSESLVGRVIFQADPVPALYIRPVRRQDQANYTCRVDFRIANSHTTHLNLQVVIPPSPPLLQIGGELVYDSVIGPLQEGDSLRLTCSVSGGEPPPRAVWHRDGRIIDNVIESQSDSQVINYLMIRKLTREFHDSTIMCSASNNNITNPTTASLTITLNLRPLLTHLVSPPRHFRSDTHHNVRCMVVGSRPDANITWSIEGNGSPIHITGQSEHGINVSSSVVKIFADLKLHGRKLVCKAYNPIFPALELMDYTVINVTYLPIVTLELGRGASSVVKEGEDVYFNCGVKSNPPTYKIDWIHKDRRLSHFPGRGIVITGHSLALRGVTREQAGSYMCSASNLEGDSYSKPISLSVNYAPICLNEYSSIKVLATGVGQPVNVTCDVVASPNQVKFSWVFNNSVTSERVPEDQVHVLRESGSLVSFVARSLQDYGTLQCWAINEIGKMSKPCMYNIVPADRPDSPSNCSVTNKTYDSLVVLCNPGFDGGLPQRFEARVFEAIRMRSQTNESSFEPRFVVTGLTPGLDYVIEVLAKNEMGSSSAVVLEAFTYKMAENRMRDENLTKKASIKEQTESHEPTFSDSQANLAYVLLGSLVVLLISLIITIVFVRGVVVRRNRESEEEQNTGSVIFLPPPDTSPNETGEAIQLEDVEDIVTFLPPPPPPHECFST